MPLSAAFHFFFPFLSKKKHHNIIFLSNPFFLFFLHISSFLKYHFHLLSFNPNSAPIFVILLLLLNITKY